ncbi:MAG: hypothetical protein WAQ98_20660 [Blastocatellia bacterium]
MLERTRNIANNLIDTLTDAIFNRQSVTTLGLSANDVNPPVKGAMFARAEDVYASMHSTVVSTYTGSQVPSVYQFNTEKPFSTFESLKAINNQIRQLCNDDPMLDTGLYILTYGAAQDGFSLSYETEEGEEDEEHAKAREKMKQAYKLMAPHLGAWLLSFCKAGNIPIQVVADENDNLIKYEQMPVDSIERNSDDTDNFPNPLEAYTYRDAVTRKENPIKLSDFQLVYGRYRREDGNPYGRSMIFPARQSSNDAIRGYGQLKKLRDRIMPIATYKPLDGEGNPLVGEALRRFRDGQPGRPETALPEIQAQRGNTEAVDGWYPYRLVNGGDFKLESANVPLGEVRDLATLVDRELAVFTVPRGLITGDVVNFATLNALLKHLYAMQRILCRLFEQEVIRPLFDRALLLAGILPEKISYEIDWGQSLTVEELQFNARLALDARLQGDLDRLTTIEILCQAFGRKDAQKIYDRIMKEKQDEKDEQEAQRQAFKNIVTPPDAITTTGIEPKISDNRATTILDKRKFNTLLDEITYLRKELAEARHELKKAA